MPNKHRSILISSAWNGIVILGSIEKNNIWIYHRVKSIGLGQDLSLNFLTVIWSRGSVYAELRGDSVPMFHQN